MKAIIHSALGLGLPLLARFPASLLCALLVASVAAGQPLHFRVPPAFPVGQSPVHIVPADVNGDGLQDLLTANFTADTVSVLLGTADGSFSPAADVATGSFPDALAAGDLNGDGRPDAVTANGNGWNKPGTLSVLLNRGDGHFGLATNLTVGQGPRGVVLADLNGDHALDLATAISGGWTTAKRAEVLLGNGDGTFAAPVSYEVGSGPSWIVAADFNHDTFPDLATVNAGPSGDPSGNTVSILLNRGDGTFLPKTDVTVGVYPGHLIAADFNRDTHPDLAVANRHAGAGPSVSMLPGLGNGAFGPAALLPVPDGVKQVAAADFNGDLAPDLIALGGSYDAGALTLFAGRGDGTFAPPEVLSVGASLEAVAAGEFTRDSRLDLAVAGGYDHAVQILRGRGDMTFHHSTDTYPVRGTLNGLIAGDFNRDGQPDLATVSAESETVSVLLQSSNGLFNAAVEYPAGNQPQALREGDFNGDGAVDLVIARFDGRLSLLRGSTSLPGVFTNPWPAAVVGGAHRDVAVGRLDGGVEPDLVTPNYYDASLNLLLGNGDGTFRDAPVPVMAVLPGPECVRLADVNGDGYLDLIVGYDSGNQISVVPGRGDGTFDLPLHFDSGELPWALAVGDLNGDGRPDLVTANYDWRKLSVLLNRSAAAGTPDFAPPIAHEVANDAVGISIADFNGDNRPDIVSANFSSVSVLLGEGDGKFHSATNYFVGGHNAAAGDFNQDGMPDLVLDLGSRIGLFWNDTLPTLEIRGVEAGMRVAWPAWKPYSLEASEVIGAGAKWVAVTDTPATSGSQFVITNAVSGAGRYYRLQRPAE